MAVLGYTWMMQSTGQIQPTHCLFLEITFYWNMGPLSMATWCCNGRAGVELNTIWPAKPKIFTNWPFTEQSLLTPSIICQLSIYLKIIIKIKTRIDFKIFVENFHTSRNISVDLFSELSIHHRVKVYANWEFLMFIPLTPEMLSHSGLYQLKLREH